MVSLVENTGDALHLNLDMIPKTLPHRLIADSSITSDSTTATVTDKDNLAILLQVKSHRTILPTNDVYAVRVLAAIISIIGKDQSANREFWALEMLNPKETIASHLEKFQGQLTVIFVREVTPRCRHATDSRLQQMVKHGFIIMWRVQGVTIHIEIETTFSVLQPTTAGIGMPDFS